MAQRLAFIHALTPLHAGTGQGVGAIDLPINRERATNLPLLPGSSIRGCLRDSFTGNRDLEEALFGSRRGDGEPSAGALRIGDAHLLLLPVRCLGATFVWTTSPFLLRRLTRTAVATGWDNLPKVPVAGDGKACVASLDPTVALGKGNRLILEDLDFETAITDEAAKWSAWLGERLFPTPNDPWRDEFKKRFAIIDDKSFDFLCEFATEISAHISIDQKTGIVAQGALWYQEALPAESVLCGVMQADKVRTGPNKEWTAAQVIDRIAATESVQFGGKAGTGLGVARFIPAKR